MNKIKEYYGEPPYYRNKSSGNIVKLSPRIRLKDGSTRTDPSKYVLDPLVMEELDIEPTTLTDKDIEIATKYKLETNKQKKRQKIEQELQQKINAGFVVPKNLYPAGAILGLSDQDVTLLTGAYILLKESVENNIANSTYITDKSGQVYCLSLEQMTPLMLAYGNYRSKLSIEYTQNINNL